MPPLLPSSIVLKRKHASPPSTLWLRPQLHHLHDALSPMRLSCVMGGRLVGRGHVDGQAAAC